MIYSILRSATRTVLLWWGLLGLGFCLTACSSSSSSCSSSCTGCCDADGTCHTASDYYCGKSGLKCINCAARSLTCNTSTGKCEGTTGSCTNCTTGCCWNGECITDFSASSLCGINGDDCQTCQMGQTCDLTTGQCSSGGGKECGATTNCTGCCTTTSPNRCLSGADLANCGVNGATCQDCTNTGSPCLNGKCSSTCDPTAKCAGRCNGAITGLTDDGCGGKCPDQGCPNGCCNNWSWCMSVDSDLACGAPGTKCTDCSQTASTKTCKNQTCVATQTCSGCLSNGQCITKEGRACGVGGVQCADCWSGGEYTGWCVNHSCEPCNPSWCTGCCDGDGVCWTGDGQHICGKNGETCKDCGTGSCTSAQTCVACSGCVSSGGLCLVGTSTLYCGKGGEACQNCGSLPCVTGQCCSGCVSSGGLCLTGTSTLYCGKGGVDCVNCGTTKSCSSSGTCI